MKKIESFLEVLKRESLFIDCFKCKEDVFLNFTEPLNEAIDIVFAVYANENYEGNAIVVYYDNRDDQYYEVNGSHCSCYGLENQWTPEVIDPMYLEQRILKGHFYDGNIIRERYLEFIKE